MGGDGSAAPGAGARGRRRGSTASVLPRTHEGVVVPSTPPHHAWTWLARQRLVWRRVCRELAAADPPLGPRYTVVDDRDDVLARLKSDYPADELVRASVHRHVDDVVFLGHAHRGLDGLGIRNAPRGMRWWLAAVTGSEVPEPPSPSPAQRRRQMQLDILAAQHQRDDLLTGWGD